MNRVDRRVLDAALRQDFNAFIQRSFQTVSPSHDFLPNWHIEAMAWRLTQCATGEVKRLIITVPPRHLKSTCASVALPAWVLGRDPTRRIICASYGNELATKHARDCRTVMESAWYRRTFPATRINPAKRAEDDFETTQHGYRLATSVGGALTGRGGSLIIVDDPIKPDDALSDPRRETVKEWFDSTLYSRLDSKRDDVIVVVMQRLHVEDLVGYLLEKDRDGWVHLDLPAIAQAPERIQIGQHEFHKRQPDEILHPERESKADLEKIKTAMGSAAFSAQYLQNPVPAEGAIIKWHWFRTYAVPPTRQPGDRIIQSWDTASKASDLHDFSVCTTWLNRGKDHYLLDVARRRVEFPALKRLVVDLFERHQPDAVLIEDAGSGTQLIQDLRAENAVRPIAITAIGNKVMRMSNESPQIEAQCVLLPEQAPWLDDFRAEVLQFPEGRFDDQVDSLSQYLTWIRPAPVHDAPFVLFESPFAVDWDSEFGSRLY